MHLTVLAVPGCPNAPVLKDRLAAVLGGRAGVSVSHQAISDEDEAARWRMRGSPTLLIDGVDPFAGPGKPSGMSCRLYRDDAGRTSGAPSAGQLRHAIEQALAAATERGDPGWLDALGRAGRGRVAPAEGGLRAVHQAVLRSFLHTGAAPGMSSLARHATPLTRPTAPGIRPLLWCTSAGLTASVPGRQHRFAAGISTSSPAGQPRRRGQPPIRRSPAASWVRPAPCKRASAFSVSCSGNHRSKPR